MLVEVESAVITASGDNKRLFREFVRPHHARYDCPHV